MVLSSCMFIARLYPVYLINEEWRQVAANSQTKPTDMMR